jgi:RNA polymerase sigma factor (sigma-70 family)
MCDYALIDELRTGNPAAYAAVYQRYFPMVAQLVRRHQGSADDAEDVFQDVVLVLHEQVQQPDFQLRVQLNTYVYAIARNRWLKQLRGAKLIPTDEVELQALQREQAIFAPEPAAEELQAEQVHAWLARITSHCQRVLTSLYFLDEPMEQLMLSMGWKNRHTADNQKYKCIQQLRRASDQPASS